MKKDFFRLGAPTNMAKGENIILPSMNKIWISIILLSFLILSALQGHAQIIAAWEVNGLSGYGVSPYAPSTTNPNVSVVGLTRGSGIGLSGTAAANAWGGNNFITADLASAISAEKFATFSITANTGNELSLSSISAYNIRRSGTGPTTGQWQYKVGNGSFVNINTAITWGSTTTATGNGQSAISLAGISALQQVPAGTTVTFRLVCWGGTGTSGTWYINNISGNDLQINGTAASAVACAPNTPAINLGNDISYCTGTNFSTTLNAGNPGSTYSWSNSATTQNITITQAGTYSVTVTDANGCVNTDQIIVTQNSLPVVNIGNNDSYCAGNNFSLTLNAGNSGSTYEWNNASTSQTLQVTQAGTYSVIVTDANGCENSDAITITENALPIVHLGNDTAYCVGTPFSHTLNAGNTGSTFEWSNASTSQTLQITQAGTYSVIVTDANGCENSDAIIVTENVLPTVNLGNDTAYCVGTIFSHTLNAGNVGSSFLWNNLSTSQTLQITHAGTYLVVVMNTNGCINSDAINVTENTLPVVNLGNDTAYCANTIFSHVLNAGNNGSTYEWNNSSNLQTLQITQAGTYSVIVTDINNCAQSDAFTVVENIEPVVNLGNGLSYCAGTTFSQTLNAGNVGSTYLWNNGTTTQTYTATQAGTYSVIVTNASNCTNTDTVIVIQRNLPVVHLGNDTSYCAGSTFSLLLNAQNPGATYSWNGGGLTAPIFAVSQAGTYSVIVTDIHGCINSDEVIVTANPLPIINLGNDTSYCMGHPLSLVLNAQNAGSIFVWNNGSMTQTVTATQAGTYSVTVTDIHGCTNSDAIIVTEHALPIINLGSDITTPNTTHVLHAGIGFSTYLWTPGAQNTPQITVNQSGTYTVTVTNEYGCSSSDDIMVSLGILSFSENENVLANTSIYPNPANEKVNIKINDEGIFQVSIISMNGQQLYSHEYITYASNQPFEIDLATIPSGMYIIKISTANIIIAKPLIVRK